MNELERLDLRRVPIPERAAKVFAVLDSLPPGGTVTVVTDNEPRGLTSRIEQERKNQAVFDPLRIGSSEWLISVRRSPAESELSPTLSLLKRTPILAALSQASLEQLAAHSTVHAVRRGQVIVAEDSDWPNLGLVAEGVLAVGSGSAHARPRIYYDVFPHEMFGEVAFFDGARANARVAGLSKIARYVQIPREIAMDVAQRDSQLPLAIGRVIAQRKRHMMEALATQGTRPIIARIAQVLVPFAVPEHGLAPAVPPLPNMTQAQIAAAAGTVKEVAARAIADLETRGMLRRERGHIRFLNREKLIALIKDGE